VDQVQGKKQPSDIVIFEMLSERYHWPPQQIRDMRQDDVLNYLTIIRAKNNIEKAQQRKNARH